jgi:hypothetical protein
VSDESLAAVLRTLTDDARTLRVTGCSSCPFAQYDKVWGATDCAVSDADGTDRSEGAYRDTLDVAPADCPLRKRSIEVVLAGDE